MPEFPEVYTIVSDLNKIFSGKKIVSVKVVDPKLAKPSPKDFETLVGNKVVSVFQVGKNIVFSLSGGNFLLFHLRMTGRLLLSLEDRFKNSSCIVLGFENATLFFTEVRKFGYGEILSPNKFSQFKQKLGQNPFEISDDDFYKKVKSKNTICKRVLLDQEVIAGIGNIYASEGLFFSKLNPNTKTKDITKENVVNLLNSIKMVLEDGIKHRGSTLPDESYVDVYGKAGIHQNFFAVYGRAKKPCIKCKNTIVEERISGRSTFYCPFCQPLKSNTEGLLV